MATLDLEARRIAENIEGKDVPFHVVPNAVVKHENACALQRVAYFIYGHFKRFFCIVMAVVCGGIDHEQKPVAAGKLQKIADLERIHAEHLFRIAFAGACGSTDLRRNVLWRDGDNELLLLVSQARLATSTRLIVISIPVFTDQTGEVEVVLPFVTNEPADSACLIAATETRPRGPAAVIDAFGESIVAVAWAALVDTTTAWAAAAGQKTRGIALAPAGFSATKSGLHFMAQTPFDGKSR